MHLLNLVKFIIQWFLIILNHSKLYLYSIDRFYFQNIFFSSLLNPLKYVFIIEYSLKLCYIHLIISRNGLFKIYQYYFSKSLDIWISYLYFQRIWIKPLLDCNCFFKFQLFHFQLYIEVQNSLMYFLSQKLFIQYLI